jgi:nucleoside recognition membrane protein YjiH
MSGSVSNIGSVSRSSTNLSPVAVLNNPFALHMHTMRSHYKEGARQLYALPVSLVQSALKTARNGLSTGVGAGTATGASRTAGRSLTSRDVFSGILVGAVIHSEGTQQLQAVLTSSQAGMKAWNENQRASVNTSLATFQATGDSSSFAAEMNRKREESTQQAEAQIDQYYDKAIEVGMKYPETQGKILTTSNSFGSFVTAIIASVGAFFTNIVNKIIQWVAQAVEWLKNAAEDIAEFFEDAASDIGDFFSSIF